MEINLTKPTIEKEELKAAADVLKSGWLIRGKQTVAFEEEFASFSGAKYGIATNGCTMALYLAVKRMNLKKEDEVIVPSLTWNATASIVIQAGATPVFADVNPNTWCLDPEDVKKKITPRTRLVIPVHFAGRYADGFEDFSIPVIFDSAHRIAKNDFRGVASCYSFYAVKNMTTIRGGMILTDNAEDSKWYQMMCHGGLSKDTLSRYTKGEINDASSFYYEVEEPGWNFDMTDVEAAIGREQLKKVKKLNAKRDAIVKRFNEAFGLNNVGNHLYPILVKDRDSFLIRMRDAGIRCGIHYLPLHQMRGYAKYSKNKLPITEKIGKHCVSIPLYADMTGEEIKYVIDQVKKIGELIK